MTPFSLSDTTFVPSGSQTARLMQGHNFDGAAMPYAPTGEVIVGSGGLYSSPGDLLRWLEWHLDRMSNQGAVERLIDHAAYLWRDGLNTVYGMDKSGHLDAMALGWVIMAPEGDRPLILQKAGGLQGILSYVAFAPARNIGVMASSMLSRSTRGSRWRRPRTTSSLSLRPGRDLGDAACQGPFLKVFGSLARADAMASSDRPTTRLWRLRRAGDLRTLHLFHSPGTHPGGVRPNARGCRGRGSFLR